MSLGNDTTAKRKPRLFPLHLSPFEFYMLADDRPDHPMTFPVQMEFSGRLRAEELEEAFGGALARHPLLSAIVRPAKRGMECWVEDPLVHVPIRWQSLDEPLEFDAAEFIDLRQEPGLRVWVQHDASRAVITAQFHHAVCDGIGAYQFLGDWLHGYAVLTGETDLPPQTALTPATLRDRFRHSLDVSKFLDERGNIPEAWAEYERMEQRGFQPLRSPERDPAEQPLRFPGFVSHTVPRRQYREIRLRAQSLGMTPNDWSLVQFFYTLRDWNRGDSSSAPGDGSLSVLVPMSLREPDRAPLPACNVVTYSLVSRTGEEMDRELDFVLGIRREMAELKRSRRESPFLMMISGARVHAEMLDHLLRDDLCLSTGTLSNTGDPTKLFLTRLPTEQRMVRSGDLRLESIGGAPPLRPNTRVAVSLFTYRRELRICMRCAPEAFSEPAARRLLSQYVSRVVG